MKNPITNGLPPKVSTTLVLIASLLLSSCEAVQSVLRDLNKPTARISSVGLTDLSLDSLSLTFDVEVTNPYSVPLPLANISYGLASEGSNFLSGTADVQGSVPANGTKTITIPARLKFIEALAALKNVKPGDVVPYTAEFNLSADAPAVGRINLPMRKQGKLPIPTVPAIELSSVDWKQLSFKKAEAVLKLNVQNRNAFPVDLGKFAFNLKLGDTQVVNSNVSKSTKFEQGASQTLSIPISIKPIDLGLAAFQMLSGNSATHKLSGSFQAGTPFGPVTMPFNKAGSTSFK